MPEWSGLPFGPPGSSRAPSTVFGQRVTGQPVTRDQVVARQLVAAATILEDTLAVSKDNIGAARAAYQAAIELAEYRPQGVQRKKAKEAALARLRELGTSDSVILGALASALRQMARTVCSRNDHFEAYSFEQAREVARVLLVVLVREVNAA